MPKMLWGQSHIFLHYVGYQYANLGILQNTMGLIILKKNYWRGIVHGQKDVMKLHYPFMVYPKNAFGIIVYIIL
jgi:hypothetical protein